MRYTHIMARDRLNIRSFHESIYMNLLINPKDQCPSVDEHQNRILVISEIIKTNALIYY